jgi:hypothetical protein
MLMNFKSWLEQEISEGAWSGLAQTAKNLARIGVRKGEQQLMRKGGFYGDDPLTYQAQQYRQRQQQQQQQEPTPESQEVDAAIKGGLKKVDQKSRHGEFDIYQTPGGEQIHQYRQSGEIYKYDKSGNYLIFNPSTGKYEDSGKQIRYDTARNVWEWHEIF